MTVNNHILVYDPIKAPMRSVQEGLALVNNRCSMSKNDGTQIAKICGVHWSMIPHNTTSTYYRRAKQLRQPERVPYNLYVENAYIRIPSYFSISVGRANNLENSLHDGYELRNDRYHLLNVTPGPIEHKGKKVLVIGQAIRHSKDSTKFKSLLGNQNIYVNTPGPQFYTELLKYIQQRTRREIIFRPRSGHHLWEEVRGVRLSRNSSILEDFKEAYVAINLTSRASVEAIVYGLPLISLCAYDAVWELSEHSLDNIENPRIFLEEERQKLLNKVSWLQWTKDELKTVEPYKHLRIFTELTKLPK